MESREISLCLPELYAVYPGKCERATADLFVTFMAEIPSDPVVASWGLTLPKLWCNLMMQVFVMA